MSSPRRRWAFRAPGDPAEPLTSPGSLGHPGQGPGEEGAATQPARGARARGVGAVLVDRFIEGRPAVPQNTLGGADPRNLWTTRVIDATVGLPALAGSCALDLEFILPVHQDSWELPWEVTLDHILKWTLDTLQQTVLRYERLAGASLVSVSARTRVARRGEETGARLVIRRVRSPERKQGRPAG